MNRFLGIFAAALLFLFLFTFFGGSYFLDIQRHFYAWMFPVGLGIAFVIWAFWRLDDKVEALQKRVDELEAAQKNAENPEKQIQRRPYRRSFSGRGGAFLHLIFYPAGHPALQTSPCPDRQNRHPAQNPLSPSTH